MNRIFSVPISIYEHTFHCIVSRDPEFVKRSFIKLGWEVRLSSGDTEKIIDGRGGLCWYGPQSQTILWVGKLPRNPYTRSALLHECTHACVQLLCLRGIPINSACDEPLAFLLDYTFMQFDEKMKAK